jgi:hypothetical protein
MDRFNPCKMLPGGHGCAAGHGAELAPLIAAGTYI